MQSAKGGFHVSDFHEFWQREFNIFLELHLANRFTILLKILECICFVYAYQRVIKPFIPMYEIPKVYSVSLSIRLSTCVRLAFIPYADFFFRLGDYSKIRTQSNGVQVANHGGSKTKKNAIYSKVYAINYKHQPRSRQNGPHIERLQCEIRSLHSHSVLYTNLNICRPIFWAQRVSPFRSIEPVHSTKSSRNRKANGYNHSTLRRMRLT